MTLMVSVGWIWPAPGCISKVAVNCLAATHQSTSHALLHMTIIMVLGALQHEAMSHNGWPLGEQSICQPPTDHKHLDALSDALKKLLLPSASTSDWGSVNPSLHSPGALHSMTRDPAASKHSHLHKKFYSYQYLMRWAYAISASLAHSHIVHLAA